LFVSIAYPGTSFCGISETLYIIMEFDIGIDAMGAIMGAIIGTMPCAGAYAQQRQSATIRQQTFIMSKLWEFE
jgi:hypothetical protein